MGVFSGVREWVYTKSIKGWFYQLHKRVGFFQLLLLFGLPFLYLDGQPAFMFDLPGRRVYLLGALFTPSDMFLVLLLGLFAAFAMFFFTALYGRLWCGYACPQTVFIHELVFPIERWIEGDRNKRIRLDKGAHDGAYYARKLVKHGLFALIALIVSMGFMSWFSGAYAIWTGQSSAMTYWLVGVFAFGWFLDFAWFREQLCNYVCPYARFQGALADNSSWIISYDEQRGEPRGGKAARDRGGCIDCTKCVVVCPNGIDIRDGYQLECIACGLCIDACDTIMAKKNLPGLIRYSTFEEDNGGHSTIYRPRTAIYIALLSLIAGVFVYSLMVRQNFEVDVFRMPGTMYQIDDEGRVRNVFTLSITNNDSVDGGQFNVSVQGLEGAEVVVASPHLEPSEVYRTTLLIRMPHSESLPKDQDFTVKVEHDGQVQEKGNIFKSDG